MIKSRLSALFLGSLLSLGVSSVANAGVISFTNSTGGVVDSASITQSVTVNPGDISGFVDSIVDVNLTVDFSKCGGSANAAGCVGDGFTFNREIVFALAFGGPSVNIVNQDTFSGQNSNGRVTQTYDDEAGFAVGGATLLNGSFQPVGSLSVFDGMSALGTWNFTFQDTVGSDPLVVHSWTLGIELRESGGQTPVPAPASIALLGLGLVGLGWSRRKKA